MKRMLRAISVILSLTLLVLSPALHTGLPVQAVAVDPETRVADSVILYLGSNLARAQGTLVPIDIGRNGTAPFLQENRTMVPIRFLAETVGGKVSYDGGTQTATITLEGYTIKVRNGDKTLRINGMPIQMPAAPVALNGRLYAPLRAISEAFGMGVFYDRGLIVIAPGAVYLNATTHKMWIDEQIHTLGMVQVAKSETALLEQIRNWQQNGGDRGDVVTAMDDNLEVSSAEKAESAAAEALPDPAPMAPAAEGAQDSATSGQTSGDANAAQDGHSTTNVQVAGVDEGDILKTDGTNLYQINRMRVLIIQAHPADQMKLLSTIQLGSENFTPQEIYVADGRLTMVGTTYRQSAHPPVYYGYEKDYVEEPLMLADEMPMPQPVSEADMMPSIWPMPVPTVQTTRVLTYDVSDPAKPARLGSYEVEGSLLSSRRIGNQLYLVTNKSLYNWYAYTDSATPAYRYAGGTSDGGWMRVPATTVSWCPDFTQANYLVVSGLQLDAMSKAPTQYTLLGAGQTIYATEDALFVAVQQYRPGVVILPASMSTRSLPAYSESTDLYRFTLEEGAATLVSRCTVPGRLLNQFSMDWYEDHLRVATTLGWASQTGEGTSSNQLYTLDAMMNLTGAILDIAPGEQIYSTRFLGDRGYMVTYRSVDPLFVLDLADPEKPAILGELKIPGYSDYLHPYQDGFLIGFGKDSVEVAANWDPGTTWAYYQGLKVALFDVRDVAHPKLMYETHIGDRGTDSELLRNHRALLFSPTRNLLAFPVNLYEVDMSGYGGTMGEDGSSVTVTADELDAAKATQYGTFTWQGMKVFRLTLDYGFESLADISHLEPGDLWNSDRYVSRGAYIGNVMYSLSNREVRATSMDTWKEMGRLVLP